MARRGHPKYQVMVGNAIKALSASSCTSQAVARYIQRKYNVGNNKSVVRMNVALALKRASRKGSVKRTRKGYRKGRKPRRRGRKAKKAGKRRVSRKRRSAKKSVKRRTRKTRKTKKSRKVTRRRRRVSKKAAKKGGKRRGRRAARRSAKKTKRTSRTRREGLSARNIIAPKKRRAASRAMVKIRIINRT